MPGSSTESSDRNMIAVTGANGFIGRYAATALSASGERVRAIARRAAVDAKPTATEQVIVPDSAPALDWARALRGAKCVLHLAGKAHLDTRGDAQLENEFRRVNVGLTRVLAEAAISAGVSRFVLVSSIGVNGSQTYGRPFTEGDPPAPSDFYARTKLEAEQCVLRLCKDSTMEPVVVRPTLVAGPGAPGNLERLAMLLRKGVPLPLAGIRNQRSLVGVRSLAELLALCCVHPAAAGRLFLAADVPPLSTTEIAVAIAEGLGVRPPTLILPEPLLKCAGVLGRSRRAMTRLFGSLVVDATAARTTLGWRSEISIHAELRELGQAARTAIHARVPR